MNYLKQIMLLLALVFLANPQAKAQNKVKLTINFSDLDNSNGKVWVAIYNSKGKWMKKQYASGSSSITNKKASISLTLPPGTYAISAFHDENNNRKLDTNSLGIPKEQYGFSNNPSARFGPASFAESAFKLSGSKTITIKF